MKKSDMTYIVSSVFVAATSIFYCCKTWFNIKLPRYYPIEHVWKMTKDKGAPSQGWYCQQVFAYLAAGIVAIIVCFILKRVVSKETNIKPAMIKSLGVIVTIIVMVCMGYMMYHEFDKWVFRS